MKRYLLIYILVLMTAVGFAKGKQLVIIHTNDTHSQIFPFSKNLMDTLKAGRAGYIRRENYIEQERKACPKLLLLDSGDFSQGSSYYTMFKGDVEVGLMNQMGYDAATIGNHEFDFGLDNMARIFEMAKFPIVCSNYDFTGTVCEKWVKPYTIIKRNGVKIGIFALCPMLDGLVFEKNCKGVKFLEPVETAKKMVHILKDEKKCDMVILISHLGWKTNEGFASDDILAPGTSGIDLILGGHTHTYFEHAVEMKNADGKTVYIDQNGKSGIFLSKFTVDLEK